MILNKETAISQNLFTLSPILLHKLILILIIVFTMIASASIVWAQRTSGRTLVANDFPGQDLGAKINAADKALGPRPGEIVIKGGGIIATQAIISSDHVLRVMPGTYITKTADVPILMKSRSSVIGSGWESILVESTVLNQFSVIMAYNQSITNGVPDTGLLIRDIQVKGANPGFNSAQQAISLGNCSGCTVDKVWINGTRSIGIQLGGSGSTGAFAENSKVTNCLFTRVASQNLALVNGRNILFEGNRFLKSGQIGGPGNTNIDLEPNEVSDRIEHVIIRKNLIDVRNSDSSPTGNGIVVQSNSGTTYVGPILVEDNTIIGGFNQGTIINYLSNGIYVFGITMKDVTVRNNVITRTGQAGLRIEGTRISVLNNQLSDVGGGGIPGFILAATNSQIVGNTFHYSGNQPADGTIAIMPGSSGNVIKNNPGWGVSGTIR